MKFNHKSVGIQSILKGYEFTVADVAEELERLHSKYKKPSKMAEYIYNNINEKPILILCMCYGLSSLFENINENKILWEE